MSVFLRKGFYLGWGRDASGTVETLTGTITGGLAQNYAVADIVDSFTAVQGGTYDGIPNYEWQITVGAPGELASIEAGTEDQATVRVDWVGKTAGDTITLTCTITPEEGDVTNPTSVVLTLVLTAA